MIALTSGMVFLIKAGILSGALLRDPLLCATALLMARWPDYAHFIFGTVAAACFFIPVGNTTDNGNVTRSMKASNQGLARRKIS